jgi:hypothetical protein
MKHVKLPIDDLLPKNDLWGEVFTHVHNKHAEGFKVERKVSCSNDRCTIHQELTTEDNSIIVGQYLNVLNDINGVEDMQKMVLANEVPCTACNLQGMATQKDYAAKTFTWAVSFDFSTVEYEKLEQVKVDIVNGKLPDTITMKNPYAPDGQQLYGLASITMRDGGNHFVSAHYIPSRGEFVYYDGIKNPRIRKFHPSDLLDEDRELMSVDYFRLQYGF